MMNGTAGIPTTKPGLVYHGVESAAGSGYCKPLIMEEEQRDEADNHERMSRAAFEPFDSPEG